MFTPKTKPTGGWGARPIINGDYEAADFEAADFYVGGVRTFDPTTRPQPSFGKTPQPITYWTAQTKQSPAWG